MVDNSTHQAQTQMFKPEIVIWSNRAKLLNMKEAMYMVHKLHLPEDIVLKVMAENYVLETAEKRTKLMHKLKDGLRKYMHCYHEKGLLGMCQSYLINGWKPEDMDVKQTIRNLAEDKKPTSLSWRLFEYYYMRE